MGKAGDLQMSHGIKVYNMHNELCIDDNSLFSYILSYDVPSTLNHSQTFVMLPNPIPVEDTPLLTWRYADWDVPPSCIYHKIDTLYDQDFNPYSVDLIGPVFSNSNMYDKDNTYRGGPFLGYADGLTTYPTHYDRIYMPFSVGLKPHKYQVFANTRNYDVLDRGWGMTIYNKDSVPVFSTNVKMLRLLDVIEYDPTQLNDGYAHLIPHRKASSEAFYIVFKSDRCSGKFDVKRIYGYSEMTISYTFNAIFKPNPTHDGIFAAWGGPDPEIPPLFGSPIPQTKETGWASKYRPARELSYVLEQQIGFSSTGNSFLPYNPIVMAHGIPLGHEVSYSDWVDGNGTPEKFMIMVFDKSI